MPEVVARSLLAPGGSSCQRSPALLPGWLRLLMGTTLESAPGPGGTGEARGKARTRVRQQETETDTQTVRQSWEEKENQRWTEKCRRPKTQRQRQSQRGEGREKASCEGGAETRHSRLWKGTENHGHGAGAAHLELIPGVRMEAVPTAAGQVQAGST